MSKPNNKESIWRSVQKTDKCWLWTGHTNQFGYGQIRIMGILFTVHRIAYELLVGPIPPEYEVDHLCMVRHCVNPEHLEAVTRAENMRRMPHQIRKLTHCKRGHELTEGAFYWVKAGRLRGKVKRCKKCERIWHLARKLKQSNFAEAQ